MRIRLRLKSSLLYKSRYLHKVINIYTLEKCSLKYLHVAVLFSQFKVSINNIVFHCTNQSKSSVLSINNIHKETFWKQLHRFGVKQHGCIIFKQFFHKLILSLVFVWHNIKYIKLYIKLAIILINRNISMVWFSENSAESWILIC